MPVLCREPSRAVYHSLWSLCYVLSACIVCALPLSGLAQRSGLSGISGPHKYNHRNPERLRWKRVYKCKNLQVRISPLLLADGAHGLSAVAKAAAPTHVVRIEAEVVRVVRVVLAERRGAVGAVGADIADRRTVAVAGSGQKD